jgi:CheY-like chemotaxis protein
MALPASSESVPESSLRIMIVDDYAYGADALSLLLTLLGHAVFVARSAADALGSFDDFKPDFCFIEIGMSEIDGYQLARSLHARPNGRHSRVVALTGFASVDDIQAWLAAGFDHHVVKPVSIEHMNQLLAGALKPTSPSEAAVRS